MGFYIRKGFNFGPFRMNVSKSGLGFSVGVKGARVGVGPRGSYVHAGRGGVYVRKRLGNAEERQPRLPETPSAAPVSNQGDEEVIESVNTSALADDAQSELLEALQRVRRRTPRLHVVLILGALVLAATAFVWLSQPPLLRQHPAFGLVALGALLLGLIVASVIARRIDQRDGHVALTFNLEPEAEDRYMKLHEALTRVAACERVWLIDRRKGIDDKKRNAGAAIAINRHRVHPSETLPRGVECNLPVVSFPAGQQTLYLFPNGIMVYDSHGVGAVPYSDVEADVMPVTFSEDDAVPSDAAVVGQTWRYVNKSGGPDRRFKDNREIPIVRYGGLSLTSRSGLNELFYTSNPAAVEPVATALRSLRGLETTTRTSK